MIKELKYFFFVLMIFLFLFINLKYYFSDENKKNSYRLLKSNNKIILDYSQKLTLLENDTNDIIEYVEKIIDKNKKNYNFWKLINNNE
jgi:septation ring formation regulator EzrA